MNQNPYRKTPVTARELLGEDVVAPVGSEDALRGALKNAGQLKSKGAL